MTDKPAPKPDTRFRRLKEKGSRDFQLACSIVDEARIGHVGFADEGQPYVVPMAVARDQHQLLLHGSVASRLMQQLASGLPCCVTITHLDGLVLARSAFNSSMHYRSLMVFGRASPVTDPDEKARCLEVLTDHLLPGRREELRASTPQEINATQVLAIPLEVFTVKISEGPPDDPARDLGAGIWAGVVPLRTVAGEPIRDPELDSAIPLPDYLGEL
ncbi:pyridoxamine 5'-phosphate oxidase family protein [Elongatibacter sediminis]|uniref:Pyridoxamine 5'-phosphate oxidase family protein n=1 Tax=Elongatibacter sediminis TaxID=3119006 RepID=A0AAW9RGK8_9GAMM